MSIKTINSTLTKNHNNLRNVANKIAESDSRVEVVELRKFKTVIVGSFCAFNWAITIDQTPVDGQSANTTGQLRWTTSNTHNGSFVAHNTPFNTRYTDLSKHNRNDADMFYSMTNEMILRMTIKQLIKGMTPFGLFNNYNEMRAIEADVRAESSERV